MTKIYCISCWDGHSHIRDEFFMSIEGMAKWIMSQKPINDQFAIITGPEPKSYEITAENLEKIMKDSEEKFGLCAEIRIRQSFVVGEVETRYILSTMNVHE